jgi:hypothetical protein
MCTASRRHARGAVVNLLDQKLWNQNPDFLSYTLSKAALEAANTMLAQALAPQRARGGRGAGPDADQPPAQRRAVSGAAQAQPAGALVHGAGRGGRRCALRWTTALTGTTLLVDGGQHLMRFDRDFSLM